MGATVIELQHVAKRFAGGRDALREINLTIGAGELCFLTGHSGAGKSTLLRLVALIERASRGRVRVAGQDLADIHGRAVARFRRQLGIVFQDHNLLFDRSVFDNVALPLVVRGVSRRETRKRVQAALDQVGLLRYQDNHPNVLSTGEQQRVGIARAIVHKPAVLLADEPTGNLDPALSAEIMQLFQRFSQVGVTMLIATHDQALIERLGQRVLSLRDGQLVGDRR